MWIRFLIITVLISAACSSFSGPLPNSHESRDALAQAVLTAIEKRDVEALHALALNRQEFTEYVWPELPSARPERNLPVGYVWGDLNQKSNMTLQKTLAAHGGQHYELIGVRYLGDTTPYKTYIVHRESELTVKNSAGQEQQVRLFGSVLEKGGRYKVFSYVIDD